MNECKIFPLGETAATVDFGNRISAETNDRVLALDRYFTEKPFSGLIETIPAYGSLTIFYDVFKTRRNDARFETAFDYVRAQVEAALLETKGSRQTKRRLVPIPVCFDREFAPDLEFVAAEKKLSIEEIVEIFLARTYRVFMLGFLPGFSYMGETDERIAAPRKPTPRLEVPRGSVGIAGRQTGIYSLESPGGWQIIARTPIRMFDPNNSPPTFLQAGDEVRFYSIDAAQFAETMPNEFEIRALKSAIE